MPGFSKIKLDSASINLIENKYDVNNRKMAGLLNKDLSKWGYYKSE